MGINEVERLKIGLMVEGIRVSSEARRAIEGDKRKPMTLAEYASTSGISLELPKNVWVNAPINEFNSNFVGETPFILGFDGSFFVTDGNLRLGANFIPVPDFYDRSTEGGEKYTSLAVTHTDRVRISPIEGCAIACSFCNLPFQFAYRKKNIGDLVESVQVALDDPIQKARHVLISGGTPKPEDYVYLNEVYERVASAFPNVTVDVMMVPMPDLLDARRLRAMGINGLSINMELYNEEIARKIMTNKHKVSRQRYLDFIAQAVEVFGEGKIRSLLMVGLEPLEDTLRGVEALASRGCDPVLSPFRPDPSTPMKDVEPPTQELLIRAYEQSREIVERYAEVKLGPRCIPCMHNTLTFPDNSGKYYFS